MVQKGYLGVVYTNAFKRKCTSVVTVTPRIHTSPASLTMKWSILKTVKTQVLFVNA